jgi:hypothetical protein
MLRKSGAIIMCSNACRFAHEHAKLHGTEALSRKTRDWKKKMGPPSHPFHYSAFPAILIFI